MKRSNTFNNIEEKIRENQMNQQNKKQIKCNSCLKETEE